MNKQKVLEAIIPEVKKVLKSPYSAVFCPAEELRVESIGSNRYKAYGYVDSQNSYGAMLREKFEYSVSELDNGSYVVTAGGVGDKRPTVIEAKQQAQLKAQQAQLKAQQAQFQTFTSTARFVIYSLLVVAAIMVIYIIVNFG